MSAPSEVIFLIQAMIMPQGFHPASQVVLSLDQFYCLCEIISRVTHSSAGKICRKDRCSCQNVIVRWKLCSEQCCPKLIKEKKKENKREKCAVVKPCIMISSHAEP